MFDIVSFAFPPYAPAIVGPAGFLHAKTARKVMTTLLLFYTRACALFLHAYSSPAQWALYCSSVKRSSTSSGLESEILASQPVGFGQIQK
jgi:hypothetical protein